MFEKTRKRFVLISMLAVGFVIVLIFLCTNTFNYVTTAKRCDEIIQFILEREKSMPQMDSFGESEEDVSPEEFHFEDMFGEGATNEIRFFIVKENEDESKYEVKTDARLEITPEQIENLVSLVNTTKSNKGYASVYRYYKTDEGLIVFLYSASSIKTLYKFRTMSIWCSLGGVVISLAFILFYSKKILKPVKDSYEKQKEFISNASHELKTPLTIISANNELIELTKGENKYSEIIAKQVSKMTAMTKNLTLLARLNEDTKLSTSIVDVSSLIKEMADSYLLLFKGSNKELVLKIEDNIQFETNSDFLGEIISIVLDNSLKYSKTSATLSLKRSRNEIIFSEKNDCESIEEGDLTKYMDRFYRNDEIRSKVAGSGIGLSIANELASRIDGKIKIYGKDKTYNIEVIFRD